MAEQFANQQTGGGSIPPPSLHVQKISHAVAKAFIERWHYSHVCPTGKNVFFGWMLDGVLYAVANYGIGVNQTQEKFLRRVTKLPVYKGGTKAASDKTDPEPAGATLNCFELKRLCRIEPKNSQAPLTKFLAVCHRILKKEHGIRFIISFSDPAHNEFKIFRTKKDSDEPLPYRSGGIYKAANFQYLGKTTAEWHVKDADGVVRHRRVAYRYMQAHNAANPHKKPMTLADARDKLKLTREPTPCKDRWFIDLGK